MLLDHSTDNDIQIFIASHSMCFIENIPIENIVWIDRHKGKGEICNDLGRILAELGSLSKIEAIHKTNKRKILFLEGKLDKRVFEKFSEIKCKEDSTKDFFKDDEVIIAKLPNGKGGKNYLKSFKEMLAATYSLEIKVACIVDNDYELSSGNEDSKDIVLSINRKEIENYLLESNVIANFIRIELERKKPQSIKPADVKDEEIEDEINNIIDEKAMKNTVKFEYLPRYRETLSNDYDPSTKEKLAADNFEKQWSDKRWKLNNCPGKDVLKKLLESIQSRWNVSLSNNKLVNKIEKCPDDIKEIIDQIQCIFY